MNDSSRHDPSDSREADISSDAAVSRGSADSPDSNDKRSFARAAARVEAYLRPMRSPEAPPRYNDGLLLPETSNVFVGSKLPREVTEFLTAMDAKLNALVAMASRDRLAAEFPIHAETQEVSGGGVLVTPVEPEAFHTLRPGEPVEVVLFLSRFPLRVAGAVAEVKPPERDDDALALEFTRIREEDLEAVIQFVFQQERRAIRERRGPGDANNG